MKLEQTATLMLFNLDVPPLSSGQGETSSSPGNLSATLYTALRWHRGFERWLPPGGHVEPCELPHQAALRECREELGIEQVTLLDFAVGPFAPPLHCLFPFNPPPPVCQLPHPFLC